MEFDIIQSFDNYIEASIIMGRLESEGINCWLKDEYTVTIDPILSNAIGGIKLMVARDDFEKAKAVFSQLEKEKKEKMSCPNCGSHDIEYVNTPRKAINWITAIATWFMGNYAMSLEKTWHCFTCNAEFEKPVELKTGYSDEDVK